MRVFLITASLSLVFATGCSSAVTTPSAVPAVREAQAKAGGGAAPGGGTSIPPPMTTDAAAQFLYSASSVIGTPVGADVNFDRLQNMSPGPIVQGVTRTATEILYNTSKKTALTVTSATIHGPNAGDFAVSAIPNAPLAPNKDTAFAFQVTFTPTGEGARTATLAIASNAGTATATLSGTGRANRPIVSQYAPLNFLPTSAPANLEMTNSGGPVLQISSVSFTGPNANMFVLLPLAGSPIGNCQFIGPPGSATIGAGQFCRFAVGLAAGATAPASAFLTIVSNDPITPVENVPVTLSPL